MSGVLQAMGVDEPTGFGTLRLSVGRCGERCRWAFIVLHRWIQQLALECKNVYAGPCWGVRAVLRGGTVCRRLVCETRAEEAFSSSFLGRHVKTT